MFWIWKRFLFFNLTGILATCGSWKLWNSIKWRYMCSKTNNDNFWLSVDCYWLKLVCELFHWWKGRNLIIFIISLDFIITIIFNVIFFINLCIVDISVRKVTWCNLLFELNDLTAFLDLVMGSILTNRQLGNQKFEIQMNKTLTGQWSLLLEISRLLDGAFGNYGIIQMNSFWRQNAFFNHLES